MAADPFISAITDIGDAVAPGVGNQPARDRPALRGSPHPDGERRVSYYRRVVIGPNADVIAFAAAVSWALLGWPL